MLADFFSILLRRRIPQQQGGNKAKLFAQRKPFRYDGFTRRTSEADHDLRPLFGLNSAIADNEMPRLRCFQQALADLVL